MKVAYYLSNGNHKGVDYSNPHKGNPGVGGTQFLFWSVSYYLSELYKDVEVIMLAPIIETLPKENKSIKCNTIIEAVNRAKSENVDLFIFEGHNEDEKIYKEIDKLKVKSIMWSHCPEDYTLLNNASRCKYLKRYVCVGKQQYDRLRDHSIFKKSQYVFNAMDFSRYNKHYNEDKKKENIVCYMGSITPYKGFHRLAKVWKQVLEKVPDAKLHVIGSGSLYNRNSKLGQYGIAEESYEKRFIKYLLDKDRNILPSVIFKGVMSGEEKLKEISNAKVGIANPLGTEETFCLVAVEFEAEGVPVVTIKKNGLLDTVKDKRTGILINSDEELVKGIVKLLSDNELNRSYGEEGIRFTKDNFDIEKICGKWKKLFEDVIENKKVIPEIKADYYWNDLKWLREINRRIKVLPSIQWYSHVKKNAKGCIKSIVNGVKSKNIYSEKVKE